VAANLARHPADARTCWSSRSRSTEPTGPREPFDWLDHPQFRRGGLDKDRRYEPALTNEPGRAGPLEAGAHALDRVRQGPPSWPSMIIPSSVMSRGTWTPSSRMDSRSCSYSSVGSGRRIGEGVIFMGWSPEAGLESRTTILRVLQVDGHHGAGGKVGMEPIESMSIGVRTLGEGATPSTRPRRLGKARAARGAKMGGRATPQESRAVLQAPQTFLETVVSVRTTQPPNAASSEFGNSELLAWRYRMSEAVNTGRP
jgi:hypothetical protein